MGLPGFDAYATLGKGGTYATSSLQTPGAAAAITDHASSAITAAGPVCPTATPVCCEYDAESRTCTGGCCASASSCCPQGKPGSGNQCTDVSSDSANCSRCNRACAGGERCCGGVCIDTNSDPNNCGGCSKACPSGTVCQNGACVCAPSTCVWNQQSGSGVLAASTCTTAGTSQFMATMTRSVGYSSFTTGAHLLVRRLRSSALSATTSLQMDTQTNADGSTQLNFLFGDGFAGVNQILFTSADRVTFQGSINGRAIAPFSINADPKSIRFADGSAIPATTVDSEVSQALPTLLKAIQGQCPQVTPSTAPAVPAAAGTVRMASPSTPAHPPGFSQAPCIACTSGFAAANFGCLGGVAAGCFASAFLYPVCAAIGAAGCEGTYFGELSGICHLYPIGGQGSPCCPVLCSTGCCGAGETCAGPGPNSLMPTLCCSAGLTGCGQSCCSDGETCVGGGACCNPANVCGGQNCCGAGEVCLPNGSCCAAASVCGGQNCCGPSEICLPNGSCGCADGSQPCGGACCTAGQCCAFNYQTAAWQCVTPTTGPINGHPWCGERAPNNYSCNCPPGQQCAPLAGTLSSDELYCQ